MEEINSTRSSPLATTSHGFDGRYHLLWECFVVAARYYEQSFPRTGWLYLRKQEPFLKECGYYLINQMSKMSQPKARERPEERSASKNFKSCKCRVRDGRLYMTVLLKTLVQLCNASLLSVTTDTCDVTPRLTAMPAEDLTETIYLLKKMLSVLGFDARGRD